MPLEDLNETLKIMPHIVGLQHITGNTYMKDFLYRIRQHMESSEDLGLLLENRCEINEAGEFVIYEEKSADARNRAVYHIVRVSGYRFVLAFMLLLKEGVNQKKPHFNPKKWVLEVAQGLAAFAEDCQSDEGYMKKCFDYFSLINNLQLFLTKRQKLELREEYGPILANSPALMAVLCTRTPSHYRELLRFTEEAKTKPLTEEAKTKPLTEEAKTKARACKSITKLNLKLRTLHLVMKSDQAAAQSELSELIAQLAEKTTAGLFLAQSEIEKHAEEFLGIWQRPLTSIIPRPSRR